MTGVKRTAFSSTPPISGQPIEKLADDTDRDFFMTPEEVRYGEISLVFCVCPSFGFVKLGQVSVLT